MGGFEKLRVGVAGMGVRGGLFASVVEQNSAAQLAALADPEPAALGRAERRFGVPGYAEYREMLDKTTLDALVIATPDFAHKDPFLAAAAKGISVFVENPFATDLSEALEMYGAVKRNGIKCRVAFEGRWNGVFVNMLEQARNRAMTGEILAINATLNSTIHVPTRMLSWANKSSPAFFLLTHVADLACYAKGRPIKSVYATGVKKLLKSMGFDTYDSIMTHIVFDDGAHASFENSWIAPESMPAVFQCDFRILGEKQAYMANFNDQILKIAGAGTSTRVGAATGAGAPAGADTAAGADIAVGAGTAAWANTAAADTAAGRYEHVCAGTQAIDGRLLSPPALMLHSFIDDVINGRAIYSNEEDGLLSARLLDAVRRSLESGAVVEMG